MPGQGDLAIWAGVSTGLLADGILIGAGTVIDPILGLLLALGQVSAGLPEGCGGMAPVRSA